jgi:hypothetical protein
MLGRICSRIQFYLGFISDLGIFSLGIRLSKYFICVGICAGRQC